MLCTLATTINHDQRRILTKVYPSIISILHKIIAHSPKFRLQTNKIGKKTSTDMSGKAAIKKVLIDLSGTLHVENMATPNAVEALKRLRDSNLEVRFVTNTTKESKALLYNRLKKLGFELEPNEIFSTLTAAEIYIERNNLKPFFLVAPESMDHFKRFKLEPNEEPNVVVIGLAPTELDYENMDKGFRCVMNGAKILALNIGKYYKTPTGLSVGAGCFVKGLEYSTGTSAIVIGKPSVDFFTSALDGVKAEEAVMIGDDVLDDVEGAMSVGINGFLVKTGKYRPGDEHISSKVPTAVFDDFAAAVDSIVTQHS